jgi:hypothetical protein
MWVKNKNTTSCMQQNASTEYKSATNKAKQLMALLSTVWKITRFLSENPLPFL